MQLRTIGLLLLLAMAGLAFAQPPANPGGQNPLPPAQRPLPKGIVAHRDLEYANIGDVSLKLDIYLPEQVTGKLPVAVWIHGGGWAAGSKDGAPTMYWALRGYAGVSINYRLSQQAIFPAQIHDCKAAIRWLRANAAQYHLDPDHIGVWGGSAGGHLVALLGTSGGVKELEGDLGNPQYSSQVQAVCDFFGPTDFLQEVGQPSNIDRAKPNCPEARLIGGPLQENPEKVARANPISYASFDDPPFLILHGDKDMTVPLNQSQLLHDALQKAGVVSTFHIVKGGGHGFGGAEISKMVQDFFDKHLKPPAKP
ncbi:MAG: alpha/beta hydrolase fold domain-containing protein [Armatimonadota bacterium]